jgi:hypothetical protein
MAGHVTDERKSLKTREPARRRESMGTPEVEDRAVHVGQAQEHAGVVDEVAGGEVVGAVDDQVVVAEDLHDVGRVQAGVVGANRDVAVEALEHRLGRLDLRDADGLLAVQDLALQVRQVGLVVVDDAEGADASRGEVERGRRAEAASADAEHAGVEQLLLTLLAHLRQDDLARVAGLLLVAEHLAVLERVAHAAPRADAAVDVDDVLVAELEQGVGAERAARTAGAVERDRGRAVGDQALDLELEVAAGQRAGARDDAVFVLLGLADVDEDRRGLRGEAISELLDRDLTDLRADVREHVLEGHRHCGLLWSTIGGHSRAGGGPRQRRRAAIRKCRGIFRC